MHRYQTRFVGLLLAGMLGACGAYDEPGGNGELLHADDGDQVAVETFDLGEAACATVTEDDSVVSNYCSNAGPTSPDASYDHTGCSDQYVVEFTGSLLEIAGFEDPGWGEAMPTTQGACEISYYSAGAYRYEGSTWTLDSVSRAHGVWSGGGCTFQYDTGYSALFWNPGSSPTKYRLAVKAYTNSGSPFFLTVKKKAKARVQGTPCFGE